MATPKTPLEKARGRAKADMIAQGHHVAMELEATAASIRARLDQLTRHEVTEWDAISGIHSDVLQIQLEAGLTELIGKWASYQFAHFIARPEEKLDLNTT